MLAQTMTISDLSQHELNWIVAGALGKAGVEVDEAKAEAAIVAEVKSALAAQGLLEEYRIHIVHSSAELKQHLSSQSILLTRAPLPSFIPSTEEGRAIEIHADLSGLSPVICMMIPLPFGHLKEHLERQFAKDNTDLIPAGDVHQFMACC